MNDADKTADSFLIEPFSAETIDELAQMAAALWPDAVQEEHKEHYLGQLGREDATVFLLRQHNTYLGFIELSSRHDYVEGAESLPVAYVEGLFIREGYRKEGRGKLLLDTAADWARGKGYSQLCSDCEWENDDSIQFHLRSGFKEVSRIVCFARDISRK